MSVLLRIAALVGVLSFAALSAAQTDRKATVDQAFIWDLFTEKVCVPRHLCNDQGFVIEDGAGLVIFRAKVNRPVNDTCSTLGEVVCKAPAEIPATIPRPTPAATTPSSTQTPPTGATPTISIVTPAAATTVTSVTATATTTQSPAPNRNSNGDNNADYGVCGHHAPGGVLDRVRNTDPDNESEVGEFPWMVSILCTASNADCRRKPTETDQYLCGGSLIAPNVVVSTARYMRFKQPSQLLVRAGVYDRASQPDRLPHVDRTVKEVVVHNEFNKQTGANSIALLILDEPYQWTIHIRPICLPSPEAQFDRAHCFVSGWGKDSTEPNSKFANILTKVDLSVVPNGECQTMLRETVLGQFFLLRDGFLCAGGVDGKDACLGDGGSPLSCPLPSNDETHYLAGLVNWGVGCGVKNAPGVYTNVAKQRAWIDQQLAQRNIKV